MQRCTDVKMPDPLPKPPGPVHNARPAEVAAPETRSRPPPESEKNPSRGVDVPEKACIMCGSLGHFGGEDGTRR